MVSGTFWVIVLCQNPKVEKGFAKRGNYKPDNCQPEEKLYKPNERL